MSLSKNNPKETFDEAKKRHLKRVRGTTRSKHTDAQLAVRLAMNDFERGHCSGPVIGGPGR